MITIPAQYIGQPDAQLVVTSDPYGDRYAMRLSHPDGTLIAEADGFRPGAMRDFGTDDTDPAANRAHTVGTFGGFLGGALEDAEAREDWELADDASDWPDALYIYAEELAAE